MQQEAAQQLLAGQGHDLAPVPVAIVLVAQLDRFAVEVPNAAVGQRDAVAI